jgi:hypothetical protein
MSKRPTQIDRAIHNLDRDIDDHQQQIKALTLARQRLVEQQQQRAPVADKATEGNT